ncbi:hypothetical protein BaRGS_00005290 [Batillaria attramentaria]|uniref:Uncharacterized protein n=1 Tax=Batillaria attramentaria TaxID=370345 RepID=A0ABD0LUV4_9CAEN
MLRYEGWDGEVPTSTSDLLQLVDELNNTHKERHDGAVVVQCSDGVTKSGLFTAVCDVINRMTDDHEVDVYMTVRQLQTVRPQAVASVVQYRFCYEVVQYRLRDMNVYANT